MFPSLFPKDTTTELEATTAAFGENEDEARKSLEDHWKSFVQDEDWEWLHKNGVNSIRVPLGYWNVDGGRFTEGTQFGAVKEAYKNSWLILKSHYIEPAAKRGISILVDLHGVPGGANSEQHSGEKNEVAEFWNSPSYQKIIIDAAVFIVKDLKKYENICGIQLVNEAEYSEQATSQKDFYAVALNAIREHDKSTPVVISDGWETNQWVDWIQENQEKDMPAGLVVDNHFYKIFSDADTSRTAEEIIKDADDELLSGLENDGKGVDFMVGEWASVLGEKSWEKSGINPAGGDDRLGELETEFGKKQANLIEKRASSGSYFWTFKFEWNNAGGWDFRQQLGKAFEAPSISIPKESSLKESYEELVSKLQSEISKTGFKTAWEDVLLYARKGSLLGKKQAVKLARKHQFMVANGGESLVSDWEKGYELGTQEIEKIVRS